MKLKLLLFLLIFSFINIYSQNYTITGKVINSKTKESLISVNVVLTREKSNEKKGTNTDKNGNFSLQGLSPARYTLKFSCVGYKSSERNFEIKNKDIAFRQILLVEDTLLLHEVTSEAKLEAVQYNGDTINYMAKAYKVEEGGSAGELLRKLPGVRTDNQTGKLQADGEEVKKILVDGKPFFGNDIKAAQKNLPANIIASIQVYNEESEQAQFTGVSTGETIKVINLVTKFHRGIKTGTFGKISGSYGTEDKNLLGGSINIFDTAKRITAVAMTNNMDINNFSDDDRMAEQLRNSRSNQDGRINGFGVNYGNSEKNYLQLSGSYNYVSNDESIKSGFRRYYYPVENYTRNYFEQNNNDDDSKNHKINLKINNPKNSSFQFSITPSLSVKRRESSSDVLNNVFINDNETNKVKTASNEKTKFDNFNCDLLLNKRLSDKGNSISVRINGTLSKNDNDRDWSVSNNYFDGVTEDSYEKLSSSIEKGTSLLSGNILYTEPISQFSALQLGYLPSYETRESDKKSYKFILDQFAVDPMATDNFRTKYKANKIGGLYAYKDRSATFNAGIN